MYSSVIWGLFNPSSSKFSLYKIYQNTEPDKLHLKFAKFTLGVHKKSSNFAVMSELGRYPYYIDIIKAMFKFWYCTEHLHPDSLLYNALECSKNIEVSSNSWYNIIKQLSNLLDIPLASSVVMKQSTFSAKLIKALKNKYLNEWHSRKQTRSVGKLDLYTNVTSIFGFEKYLNHLSFPYGRDITRLRISSHKLNIEIGRYARLDRADHLCSKCSLGVLGDEIHFLLEYPAFNTL